MSRAENALRPAQQLCGVGASAVPRAILSSARAHETHGASAESSTSPSVRLPEARAHARPGKTFFAVAETQRITRRASSKKYSFV